MRAGAESTTSCPRWCADWSAVGYADSDGEHIHELGDIDGAKYHDQILNDLTWMNLWFEVVQRDLSLPEPHVAVGIKHQGMAALLTASQARAAAAKLLQGAAIIEQMEATDAA